MAICVDFWNLRKNMKVLSREENDKTRQSGKYVLVIKVGYAIKYYTQPSIRERMFSSA